MNCLEFRRISLSDPGTRDPDYSVHRGECEDCSRYADGVSALDDKIKDALRVPVPEDLTSRIKLRQVIQGEQTTRRVRPWHYAMAASIFVMVALSGLLGYQVYTTNQYLDRLSLAAVDHTRMERQGSHFVAAHEDPFLQQQRFAQILASFGGKVMDDVVPEIGPLIHVQVCALAHIETPVAHAQFLGKAGLVTIYYVIGPQAIGPETFAADKFEGMLVPVGQGNLVVVGNPGEPLDQVAHNFQRAVAWEI